MLPNGEKFGITNFLPLIPHLVKYNSNLKIGGSVFGAIKYISKYFRLMKVSNTGPNLLIVPRQENLKYQKN